MSEKTIISGEEIRDTLMKEGVPAAGIYCLDGTYQLLTETDVREKLSGAFTEVLLRLGVRYEQEAFDCENFGAGLWWWTSLWHSKQRDRGNKSGVGLGLMCNSDLGHGFGFAVHKSDAGLLYAVGLEPQLGPDGFSCHPIRVPWERSFLCVC